MTFKIKVILFTGDVGYVPEYRKGKVLKNKMIGGRRKW